LNLTPKEIRDQLVLAIDEAITKGRWESSLFLKNTLKQLQTLRAHIIKELGEEDDAVVTTDSAQAMLLLTEREGYERIYIALYQSESDNLDRWFSTIKMLTGYSMSRPVYRSEEEVRHMIREKQTKSDAYVIVWVKQADILPSYSGVPLKDRWGYELLTIKEGAVRSENIVMFVYNDTRYRLTHQSLLPL
jgi:Dot/Icm secretion system protein IcmQ